jgi:hypothetical protein
VVWARGAAQKPDWPAPANFMVVVDIECISSFETAWNEQLFPGRSVSGNMYDYERDELNLLS